MCKDRIWKSEAGSCNSLQLVSKQKLTNANWSKLFRKIRTVWLNLYKRQNFKNPSRNFHFPFPSWAQLKAVL